MKETSILKKIVEAKRLGYIESLARESEELYDLYAAYFVTVLCRQLEFDLLELCEMKGIRCQYMLKLFEKSGDLEAFRQAVKNHATPVVIA